MPRITTISSSVRPRLNSLRRRLTSYLVRHAGVRRITALALMLMLIAPAPMLTSAVAADARQATSENAAVAFVGTLWTKLLAQLGAAQPSATPAPVDDSMPGQQDPPRPEPRPIIETPSQAEREARVTSLQIGGTSALTLRAQQTRSLSALPLDADGQAVHGLSPTWESSAPTIASVTPEGDVTAHTDTQVVRFYYETVTLSGTFAAPLVKSAPATARLLRYLYFPGTASGYSLRYAAPYGVIDRISKREGMTISTTSLLQTER